MQRVWQELYYKDRNFVVAYNREFKHNETTDGIDVPVIFRSLFKDKSSTPRENQTMPRLMTILNLNKYNK